MNSTDTTIMDNYIAALADAFDKQVDIETFKHVAASVLDKLARAQWNMDRNPYTSETDSEATIPDNTNKKTKKKRKPRDNTPIDKDNFIALFKDDPTKVQRTLLTKAAGKNGWNVYKSFQPTTPAALKSPVIGLTNAVLIEELKLNIPELN